MVSFSPHKNPKRRKPYSILQEKLALSEISYLLRVVYPTSSATACDSFYKYTTVFLSCSQPLLIYKEISNTSSSKRRFQQVILS